MCSWLENVYNWGLKNIYSIGHCILFISLTAYIILNWKVCISMQFFSQFDGNNILFIVWLVLTFLLIYDVEANGIKLKRHKIKEEYENADRLHTIELLSQNNNQMLNSSGEGDVNSGSSN